MKLSLIYILLLSFSSAIFADTDFDIHDYGAIGDGMTLNTAAIQKAIDEAHKKGKSRVVVPRGRFLTGSFTLRSGVELHLSEGAVLLGSTKFEHHLKVEKSYMRALIMSSYQDDISITGTGCIDGQGRATALRTDSLFHVGALDQKYYNKVEGRPRFYMRPMLVVFVGCTNVKVSDVLMKNSASWVQHYDRCQNLTIKGITVESDAYWNNDGIDISDSQNVHVSNCVINAADDGICLKSHYDDKLLQDVVIENCLVRSSASAIKFGTKSLGGFKNVTVKNIKIYDTFRSAIAIESVDGGILEDITIDSIDAINTGNAIFIKLGHREEEKEVGTLKNVTISNVRVQVAFERPDYAYDMRGPELPFFHNTFPSSITGMPGHHIQDLTLENIQIIFPGRGNKALAYVPLHRLGNVPENAGDYPEFSMFGELPAWGFYVRHVKGLQMKNVRMILKEADYRSAIIFDDVHDLELKNVKLQGDHKEHHFIYRGTSEVKTDTSYKVMNLTDG